jgi:hypothetical protein
VTTYSAILALISLGFVFGACLGLRYSFYLLIPAVLCDLLLVVAIKWTVGLDMLVAIIALISSSLALQIGYVTGAAIQLADALRREKMMDTADRRAQKPLYDDLSTLPNQHPRIPDRHVSSAH